MSRGQNYYSFITIFILFCSFTLFNILYKTGPVYMEVLAAASILWAALFIVTGRFYLSSILPIASVLALQLSLMTTVQSLVFFHICLSLILLFFSFLFSLSFSEKLSLLGFFTLSYLTAALLNNVFSLYTIGYYGGIQMYFLAIALCVRSWQMEQYRKENGDLREQLAGMKTEALGDEDDPFVGIFSKAGGMKVLKQTMKWSQRYELPLTVCYIDLNTSRDEYIHNVSRRISTRVRESDTLFRLGSTEILLVLPDCHETDAIIVVDQIQKIIKEDLRQNKTISVGIAGFDRSQKISPNELIINANRASA
ncbi:MAG: diguanylate cyclase [Spirochaetales bacterium]|nr:diguanylate cyclase [Spirochaetales bacterium]